MKLQFFGASYDIVKKSLIVWLGEFGPWAAHPMFTETVNPETLQIVIFKKSLPVCLAASSFLTSF